jgi:stearoyl-CoA desaturase (delta-9 desaturase)
LIEQGSLDYSRNNVIIGLLSNGEGWRNNHHADPRAARHGHRSWEFDVTWLTIRALESFGLATRIIRPTPHIVAAAAWDTAIPIPEPGNSQNAHL